MHWIDIINFFFITVVSILSLNELIGINSNTSFLRIKNRTFLSLYYVVITILFLVAIFYASNLYLFYLANLFLVVVLAINYKKELKEVVLKTSIYFLAYNIFDLLFSFVLSSIIGKNINLLCFEGIVFSRLIIFFTIRLYNQIKNKQKTQILATSVFICEVVIGMNLINFVNDTLTIYNDYKGHVFSVVILIFYIILNIVLSYLFDRTNNLLSKEKENEIKINQINNERKYYKDLYEKQAISDKYMHDLKYKVFSLKELIIKDLPQAKEQINSITETLDLANSMKITGIASVDALLASFKSKCSKENIVLETECFIADSINIEDEDLCVVIGNLLENALEASIKCHGKMISLIMKQDLDYLNIEVVNNTPLYNKLENNKTTKEDKLHHGFGLENIKQIVEEQYNGICSFKKDGNHFISKVMVLNEPIIQ